MGLRRRCLVDENSAPTPTPLRPTLVEEASGHAENTQRGVCLCAPVTEEAEWSQSLVLREKRGGLADAGGSGAPEFREVAPARGEVWHLQLVGRCQADSAHGPSCSRPRLVRMNEHTCIIAQLMPTP